MPQVFVQGKAVDSYPVRAPEARRGAVRRVTEVGEAVLRRPARAVTAAEFGTAELAALVDDMFLTMYVADGCGLAANQVDVGLRLFVYDCPDEDGNRHVGHIANPVLDPPDGGPRRLLDEPEGCLSVPGAWKEVPRADRAVVRGFDLDGRDLVIEGQGYFARCLQHETDHCDGQVYVDRLGARDRRDVLRQAAELREGVFARRAAKEAELAAEEAELAAKEAELAADAEEAELAVEG
ncbi:Peptide deformylase [Actinobacteria bacterium OK074]|nr:Peptide deformylase [Actinobacteria bacterium OK074]